MKSGGLLNQKEGCLLNDKEEEMKVSELIMCFGRQEEGGRKKAIEDGGKFKTPDKRHDFFNFLFFKERKEKESLKKGDRGIETSIKEKLNKV